VGISEQARNITDTSLRLVLAASDDPARAIKDHLLRLEGSLRDLIAGEELLAKQCAWLFANMERNLKLAESEEARAARLLQLGREDDARQALADKRESLIRVTADQRRLTHLETSLPPLRKQLAELRERIDQARAIRARLAAGQPLGDDDLHRPGPRDASQPAQAAPTPASDDQPAPSPAPDEELDRELERLRRRLADSPPEEGS
jgi:hypothetical protein